MGTMTNNINNPNIYALADVITGRPHNFAVGKKHLQLFPITLAKIYILQPYYDAIGFGQFAATSPQLYALKAVKEHRSECCTILAYHATPNTYKDLFCHQKMVERRNIIDKASPEDLATLLLVALTADKTEELVKYLGLDKEQERMANVMKVKKENGKNNVTFGGITIFGSFIGQLKELGYTDNEIIYERPYGFLRLMLADKVVSVYLSDDELQNLTQDDGGTMIDGNSPDAYDALKGKLAGKLKFKD